VGRSTLTGDWRKRPALALLAWNTSSRGPIIKTRKIDKGSPDLPQCFVLVPGS